MNSGGNCAFKLGNVNISISSLGLFLLPTHVAYPPVSTVEGWTARLLRPYRGGSWGCQCLLISLS